MPYTVARRSHCDSYLDCGVMLVACGRCDFIGDGGVVTRHKGDKVFSTAKAAREWIEEHRPQDDLAVYELDLWRVRTHQIDGEPFKRLRTDAIIVMRVD